MKKEIKVKNGRAYLHIESIINKKLNIKSVNIIPLGDNTKLIKRILDNVLKCSIMYI